jgi:hypothetical protein
MRQAINNPPDNQLYKGTSEAAVIEAIDLAGYPLQSVVADHLVAHFGVTEEWGYIDRDTQAHRSLDVFAFKTFGEAGKVASIACHAAVLVECKRSRAPFVFFQRVADRPVPGYPSIAGSADGSVTLKAPSSRSQRSVAVADVLGLRDVAFVADAPPRCSAFTRAELHGERVRMSGEEAYNGVVLPLVKAADHAANLYNTAERTGHRSLTMLLPVAVLDAPMLLIESPTKSRDPIATPWVRIVRQEAKGTDTSGWFRWYAIDAVHASYFPTYLEHHLLPFLQVFADRVSQQSLVLRSGGVVPDLATWVWSDIQADSSPRGA